MIQEAVEFLLRHGYALLVGFVFAEQLGLPVPALPVLLAMGALAGAGQFSLAAALFVAAAGALLSDLIWYALGRHRGHSVLRAVCRISLEPDSCVRNTQNTFTRYGPCTLLFAKFVPGLNTVAPPLAGMSGLSLWRFLICDGAGALIWAGAFLGTGYLFSSELERIAEAGLQFGSGLVAAMVIGLAAYILWKYLQRRRFLSLMRVTRITPQQLWERIQAGDEVMIVDLRHSMELELDSSRIPGAMQIRPDELEGRSQEIPRDREIILYCT